MTLKTRTAVRSAWGVGALVIASAALGLQGWKSRIPTVDLLPNIDDARAFEQAGRIPRAGTLSSFVAFTPPGTTWLLVPGVMLSDDVRTLEYAATTTLHVFTVLGIFLLARSAFGAATAYTAATTFAFSSIGLFFATSLWPRGHPAFFVWFVYALHRWVLKGKPRALAEAILIWAAGMYVFMEIAPAILAIPVAFLLYRPRTHLPSMALAIVIVALIWEPYLAFQYSRGFVDLKALLRRESVYSGGLPGNYRHTWCDPTLPLAGVVDETAVKTVALNMGRQVESAGWKHALVRPGVAVVLSSAEVLRNAAGSFAVALNLNPLRYLLLGATILSIWSCRP